MHVYNLLNEDETRYNQIDPLVKKAGWDLADRRSVGFEIPVDGYNAFPITGITDADVECKLFLCINEDWKLATCTKHHLQTLD